MLNLQLKSNGNIFKARNKFKVFSQKALFWQKSNALIIYLFPIIFEDWGFQKVDLSESVTA